VILSALSLVFIVTIVGLLPSYILSDAREKEALERVRIIESAGKKDYKELEIWMAKTNLILRTLSPRLDADRPSDYFENILSEKIPGIKITNLLWDKKGSLTILVEGQAVSRQSLTNFETGLKQSNRFKEVILPISNLAKDENIGFQIKITPNE
jgi:hypothetical protein